MVRFKNIRVKKKGGGSRLQRVKVLASGKYKFVKNLTKRKSPRKSTKKKTSRKVKKMGKKKSRRRRQFTLPLGPILGLAAGLGDQYVLGRVLQGNYTGAIQAATHRYTGYNMVSGAWEPMAMTKGLLPLAVGLFIHKFVGGPPLNANKMLAAAGVPVIRI